MRLLLFSLLSAVLLTSCYEELSNNSSFNMPVDLSDPLTPPNDLSDPTITGLTDQSALVFKGTLDDITYRDSSDGIPHTFARYQVDEVLKGFYDQPYITLRFAGGYFDDFSGRRLIVSHMPKLTVGDKGVMMVGDDNGQPQSLCPLSGCSHGRFLFAKGQVLDGGDNILARNEKGMLSRISSFELDSEIGRAKGAPMSEGAFTEYLRNIIAQQEKENPQQLKGVADSDPDVPFEGPKPMVSTGPADTAKGQPDAESTNRRPATAFEQWESQQLSENGGNPVLGKAYPGDVH